MHSAELIDSYVGGVGKVGDEKAVDEHRGKSKYDSSYRVPTGVIGLDDIMGGGLPSDSTILVTGGPGVGKTILCLQFLVNGALHGEPGIMISMDERPEDLRKETANFGWDLAALEEEGKLAILDVSFPRAGIPSKEKYKMTMPFTLDHVVSKVYDIITEIGAKRIVLDSLPAFGLYFKYDAEVRLAIHRFTNLMAGSGCVSLITSEITPGHSGVSRFGVEEFIARGIILLELIKRGSTYKRAITVLKMRETKYKVRSYPFDITDKGIVVSQRKGKP